jgi:hypothetical protein
MTRPSEGLVRDRRAFIGTLAGSLLAAPLAIDAQQAPKVARLGILLFSTPTAEPNLPALLAGLRDLGYVEARNIVLVDVYDLVGVGSVRSPLQAAAARGLTRFVGRDPEMEHLRLALESAGGANGQVVAVIGEPGVGKSRLYWEFIHSPLTAGWLVLESRSVSYGKATSYLPVIDLLKGYFQIEAQDEPGRMHETVTGKLLSLDEALRPTLPAFLNVPRRGSVAAAIGRLLPQPQRSRLDLPQVGRRAVR